MRQKLRSRFNPILDVTALPEYKEASNFYQKGKYRLSDEFFKRALHTLENQKQLNSQSHIHLLKKYVYYFRLALNQIQLKRNDSCEKFLEEAISIIQNTMQNDNMLYQEYSNLLIHCLKTNVNKAIILSNALLSTRYPQEYKKTFLFHLGTANLLKGNFETAKTKLKASLESCEDGLQKGQTLNNLAVACWWHRYPNSRELESSQEDEEQVKTFTNEQIIIDYEMSINLFKQSLSQIEGNDYDQLLSQKCIIPKDVSKYDPSQNVLLKQKQSGIPLLNLGEYLINCRPELKNEATFWFKYQLKFFEQNDPQNIERTLVTLAQLCVSAKEYVKAEGLFLKALDMMENNDSYNKVLALQLYGNMLKKQPQRQKEGEQMISESFYYEEQMPTWSNRIIHVSIPQIQL